MVKSTLGNNAYTVLLQKFQAFWSRPLGKLVLDFNPWPSQSVHNTSPQNRTMDWTKFIFKPCSVFILCCCISLAVTVFQKGRNAHKYQWGAEWLSSSEKNWSCAAVRMGLFISLLHDGKDGNFSTHVQFCCFLLFQHPPVTQTQAIMTIIYLHLNTCVFVCKFHVLQSIGYSQFRNWLTLSLF